MATHDYVLANQSGSSFRTDLNNALAAVVSNNSNATEPSTKYAYELWADTNSGYLKIRNAANNAWIQLFKLDGTLSDIPVEGTVIKSTGESGGTKFLREDGDNSCSWQSISQTALTGSTNNTVCTVTGANAIQGESDFVFDGSLLGVGTSSPTQGYGIDKTIHIHSSASSGNRGAGLHLTSNSTGTTSNDGTRIVQIETDLMIYNHENSSIYFGTNATERAVIDSSGNLKISDGDLVIGGTGHGIDFSNSQTPASGMTSETLDSYEEGTWTPAYGASSVPTSTYTQQDGYYTKIGNLVTVTCKIVMSAATTNANPLTLGGFPFVGSASGGKVGGMDFTYQDNWYSSSSGGNAQITFLMGGGVNYGYLYDGDGNTTAANSYYDIKRTIYWKGMYYV